MRSSHSAVPITIALLIALLTAGGAMATEIFVWQHDNGLGVLDPVYQQNMTSTQAITATLDDLGRDYTLNASLPNDLSGYDIVITSLSFYCPG